MPALVLLACLLAAPASAQDARDHLFMAQEWQTKGNLQAARDTVLKALELEPGNAFATIRLAQIEAAMGDPKTALKRLEGVLAAEPGNLLALDWKGNILLASGDPTSAMASFQAATARDGRHVWSLLGEACCLLAQGKDQDAAKLLAAAKECAGEDSLAHRMLGETFLSLGLFVNARLELERSLELSQRDPAALSSAASAYLRLHLDGLAHNAWRQALVLDSTYDRARFGLLTALGGEASRAVQAGQTAEAARIWRTMLTYAPRNEQALNGLRALAGKK